MGTKTITGVIPGFTTNVPGQSSTKSHYYNYDIPNNRWESSYFPYISTGITAKLNSIFNFRGQVVLGKTFSIGMGIGIIID
jgi:hypothetical protein